jgi:GDP-4-dehydro-6-deoxy-D-mannose reductase
MTTALVLAGDSFVGKHLCHKLRQAGWQVWATTRKANEAPGYERCDLCDADRVDEVVSRSAASVVFQCAGATHSSDPRELYNLHVDGILNVLTAVRKRLPPARVVLLGSAGEYGLVPPEALPVNEDYPCTPVSFFGASKLAQTELARAAAAEWKMSLVVVRPFNILGPGLPPYYFARSMAERLCQAKSRGSTGEISVVNAEATRDFVDVRDVVEALVSLGTGPNPCARDMELFNIASGRETRLLEVAQKLCTLAGDFRAVASGTGQSRSSIHRSCGDSSKLRRVTGWTPRISWENSIKDLWISMGEGIAT